MNNMYLIPANAKKGNLFLNIFRWVDVGILGLGIVATFYALMKVDSSNIVMVLLACLPAGICLLLVFPLPYYHNVLCLLQSIYHFFRNERVYRWKGWCFYERFIEDAKKQRKN